MKFKIGQRVKETRFGSGAATVVRYAPDYGNDLILIRTDKHPTTDFYVREKDIEPLDAKTETRDKIQELVNAVNAGIAAYHKLHNVDISWTDERFSEESKLIELVLYEVRLQLNPESKKPPQYEEWTTSNGWQVSVTPATEKECGIVHIGPMSFRIGMDGIEEALDHILVGNYSRTNWLGDSEKLSASRNGVKYKNFLIPWSDAERLYNSLVQYSEQKERSKC